MAKREEILVDAVENLLRIRNECSCVVFGECGHADLTVKQVACLKLIDREGDITFSRLAEITRTSPPTVTEMVNRCARMECVYRERSPDDRRVQYIRLTEKGRQIARAERTALTQLVERMVRSLDHRELDLLVEILEKVR
ncbi:MarR family protein [anaerobic digester metagenome]